MKEKFSASDLSRIIEMAWEDRTPFEAIKINFGLNEASVIKLMRRYLIKIHRDVNFNYLQIWYTVLVAIFI